MDPCLKCKQPVGGDAIFLKNGTFMCPRCYAQYYASKNPAPQPPRVYINVEAIITLAVIVGAFAIGYKIYSNSIESAKQEKVVQRDREAIEFKLEQERLLREQQGRRAAEEASRKKAEDEHKRLEAIKEKEHQDRIEREKVLAEAAKVRAEIGRIEREKSERVERQKDFIDNQAFDPKVRKDPLTPEEEQFAKERSLEISQNVATVVDAQKSLKTAEAAKADLESKVAGWKIMLAAAINDRENLQGLYKLEFPAKPQAEAENITIWRNQRFDKPDYAAKIKKYDDATNAIAKSASSIEKSASEISALEKKIAALSKKIETAHVELKDLKASPEEMMGLITNALRPDALSKSTLKHLLLKDGTTLTVKSFMIVDAEVLYKDEQGKSHSIKRDDVEKFN